MELKIPRLSELAKPQLSVDEPHAITQEHDSLVISMMHITDAEQTKHPRACYYSSQRQSLGLEICLARHHAAFGVAGAMDVGPSPGRRTIAA